VIRVAIRIYAALLRAYPVEFRRRCGAPMLRTFEEWCAMEAARRSRARFLRHCAAEYIDALAGAWRLRRPHLGIGLAQDTRYALRRLVTQPLLVFFTVSTLGFAIAANTSLFSVVDAMLLRPSPFPDPGRLFQVINRSRTGTTYAGLSATKLRFWRGESDLFESVETYRPTTVIVTGGVEPEELPAAEVSPGLLAMLGVSPRLGRVFTPGDAEAAQRSVIVSEPYWRTRFGADDNALGHSVAVNGKPHTIIGVMPARFHFPTLREQLWLPFDASSGSATRPANTIVRLRAGLTVLEANARIDAVVARLNAERPIPPGWGVVLDPGPLAQADARTGRAVLILFGAVGLVLLTACANVANLLLSRAIDRQREFASAGCLARAVRVSCANCCSRASCLA